MPNCVAENHRQRRAQTGGQDLPEPVSHDRGGEYFHTKFHDEIDNNPYNLVLPPENLLHVGWVEPQEWLNMTVRVERSGAYTAELLYTSSGGGELSAGDSRSSDNRDRASI